MRKLLKGGLLVLICLGLGLPLLAQTNNAQVNNAVELTRAMVQTKRKALVTENLQLTAEESGDFWPLYGEYQEAQKKSNDGLVRLIADYAKNYDSMDDKVANDLIRRALNVDRDKLKLKRKWFKKFNRFLSPKKAARWLQLENKMDAAIEYDLARDIPLVKE